jgi:hypothetical protein
MITIMLMIGDTVHKVGRTTGWTKGVVTRTCFDQASFDQNVGQYMMLCQIEATLTSAGGDSGSPVFIRLPNQPDYLRMAGILWGGRR